MLNAALQILALYVALLAIAVPGLWLWDRLERRRRDSAGATMTRHRLHTHTH